MLELATLQEADQETVERFFAEADAEELVESVAAMEDDELRALVEDADVRTAAIGAILARLHEFAIPERLDEVVGVVRLDLKDGRRVVEQEALRFCSGTIDVIDPDTPADVVLTSSVLGFVRLVTGEANAGLEHLSGRLGVDGDADLALAVGGIFRVPGQPGVAVDPRALDPVEVAEAIDGVSVAHLKNVMSGGFRAVVLTEIFRRLPEFVDEHKARRSRLVVAFRLTGSADGEVERYVVTVADGRASVSEGDSGERRDATITCTGHDFLRLATGHLNAVAGVMKGTLKVKGDRAKALQLSGVLDIPGVR